MVQILEGLEIVKYGAVPLVLCIIKITTPCGKDCKCAEPGCSLFMGRKWAGYCLSRFSASWPVADVISNRGCRYDVLDHQFCQNSRGSACHVTSQKISHCAAWPEQRGLVMICSLAVGRSQPLAKPPLDNASLSTNKIPMLVSYRSHNGSLA